MVEVTVAVLASMTFAVIPGSARLIIVAAIGIGWLPLSPAAEDPPSEQQLAAINTAIANVETWLQQASRQRPEYERNLQAAESRLSALSQEITTISANIDAKSAELDALQQRRQTLTRQKQELTELIEQLLRAVYMEGQQSTLKLVFNQQDPAEAARMLYYQRKIQDQRLARIEEYEQTLTNLNNTENSILAANNELILENERLALRQQALETEKHNRQLVLNVLDSTISERDAELQKLQEDRDTLESLLEAVRQASETLPVPGSQLPFTQRQGQLPWPGSGPLLSTFGERFGNGELRRQGLTIGAEAGDPVRAVHGGRVVFANWLRGSGLLVIVDHGDGYLSLYGHNETLIPQLGDWVEAGQVIARAGSSGGQQQTGIYLEIRYNGRPVDPLTWLEAADR